MKNKCKHGDIFYVVNGGWEGVYSEKPKHSISIYPFSLEDCLKKGDVTTFPTLESRTWRVDDEYMDSLDIEILGNVFDIVKQEVEDAKEELEEAKYRLENIEKFSKELPNLISFESETK